MHRYRSREPPDRATLLKEERWRAAAHDFASNPLLSNSPPPARCRTRAAGLKERQCKPRSANALHRAEFSCAQLVARYLLLTTANHVVTFITIMPGPRISALLYSVMVDQSLRDSLVVSHLAVWAALWFGLVPLLQHVAGFSLGSRRCVLLLGDLVPDCATVLSTDCSAPRKAIALATMTLCEYLVRGLCVVAYAGRMFDNSNITLTSALVSQDFFSLFAQRSTLIKMFGGFSFFPNTPIFVCLCISVFNRLRVPKNRLLHLPALLLLRVLVYNAYLHSAENI